jgi:hypothetical protein
MEPMNSVKIVEEFWSAVWKARNPAAIDNFVVDDFVLTTGGIDVVSREKFNKGHLCSWRRSTIFDSKFLRHSRNRLEAGLHQGGALPGRTMACRELRQSSSPFHIQARWSRQ